MEQRFDKSEIADIIGLSPLQKGMLFHYLENPNSEAYVEKVCIELSGPLDIALFEESWQSVMNAHDTLKTIYRWEKIQNPAQIILKEKKINLEIYDLFDSTIDIQELIQSKKVNLHDSPFAIVLIKGTSKHYLWLVYAHILLDGWSISLLIKEFLENYHQLVVHSPLSISDKPKFKSYIKYLQTCSTTTQESYWKSLLNDVSVKTNLLPDHPFRTNRHEYKWFYKEIDQKLLSTIRIFAQTKQTSIPILIYLAWSILIHKYGEIEDTTFGISISLRNLPIPDLDKTVGLLINTIPLRLQINVKNKISDLLASLHNQFIQSQSHASLPLPDIKRAAGLSSREELFDSLVVVENYPIFDLIVDKAEQLSVSDFSNREFTHYPLTIIVDLLKNANVKISYDSNRYSEKYISQITNHFLLILSQIVSESVHTVGDIRLLSSLEAKEIFEQFNPSRSVYPKDVTVVDVFKTQVENCPYKIAVVSNSHQISFLDLDKRSEDLAQKIIQLGIIAEEKIGIMLPKGLGMIIALLAILKANAAYVPINPRLPQSRKDYYVDDCHIRYVVTQDGDQNLVILPTGKNANYSSINNLASENSSPLAYVLYSSGSTGNPKGIMIDHRGIIRLVKNTKFISFNNQDCLLSTCPLEFDVSMLEIWGCLLNGSKLILIDEPILLMPDKIKEILNQAKVNKLWLSTPLFNAWVNADLSLFQEIDYVIIGGDTLSPSHVEKVKKTYPNLKLVNGYGPTENTVLSTTFEIEDAFYARIPIGYPIANSSAYIVDPIGNIQPIGAIGEIWLGGDGVARGYQNKVELSHDKFIDNPFGEGKVYKSGDLGRWLPDGSIDFFGRKDFQVKVRGHRIEIAEVELAIKSYYLVSEAVVTAEENENQEKELIAYVQNKSKFAIAELKQFLSNLIPQYCIPTIFVLVESFPYTSTGKIDRQGIRKLRKNLPDGKQEPNLPVTELEKSLAYIYEKVLQRSPISLYDNFFDLGGNSIHTIQIRSLIQKELQKEIPITDIFQFPTVASLAKYLQNNTTAIKLNENINNADNRSKKEKPTEKDIAIIGISCKFPGGESTQEFWNTLKEGQNAIKHFSQTELSEEGIPEELFEKPNYIGAKGALKDIEHFDHHFFGYTEREAEMMDPQLRLLHECCWNVLEDAGCVPDTFNGKIGLFVGNEVNVLWLQSLLNQIQDPTERWQAAHYNIHAISTSVSYKLKLTGPSLTIDTACSSSLVAIHEAKQSILCGECDVAIAGGVSIELPKRSGYLYEEGMIRSSTGECKAFDANANGTVSGDGVGLVLLKPLSKAIADGDHIYAILKGSAINNDGDRKVGFTAPSVSGQIEVLKMALKDANLCANDISYIETHGTATKLGDPIEVKALSQVYSSQAPIKIGSVKTNIGHLNTASGVAGFIKTALALHHQFIPASLHFETENPDCNFSKTSLRVNQNGQKWVSDQPRFAAVSSFGIGGTNSHAILEEFITNNLATSTQEESYLLLFSAKSKSALERRIKAHEKLMSSQDLDLNNISYTLQTGRKHFEYRAAIICQTKEQARKILAEETLETFQVSNNNKPSVAFIFPGQGAQSIQVSKYLYDRYPIVKKYMDQGFKQINDHYGLDLKTILFTPSHSNHKEFLKQTHFLQVITFIYGYSLTKLLQEVGVHPQFLIGHSVGEYIAASLEGVFSFEEAIGLLIERGKLMNEMNEGKMVAIRSSKDVLKTLLELYPKLALAANNSPDDFVLSGDCVSIDSFIQYANANEIPIFLLNTNRAFHSKEVKFIQDKLLQLFSQISLQRPKNKYVSTLTGELIDSEKVITPEYWVDHACETVQFSKGIQTLQSLGINLFLELGPVKALTTMIKRQIGAEKRDQVISNVTHSTENSFEPEVFLSLLQQLWQKGVDIEWQKIHSGTCRKVALPGYPFDRYYFWKFGKPQALWQNSKPPLQAPNKSVLNFFTDIWEPISLTSENQSKPVWLFHKKSKLDLLLLNHYKENELFVDFDFSIEKNSESFTTWFKRNPQTFQIPYKIIYTLSYEDNISNKEEATDELNQKLSSYFHPLLRLVQILGETIPNVPLELRVIGNKAVTINDTESVDAIKSTLLAFLRNISNEYPNIKTQFVDVESNSFQNLFSSLESEINSKNNSEVALRKNEIFGLTYKNVNQNTDKSLILKKGGLYCITGGTGGIGLVIAEYLAANYNAHVILMCRSSPDKAENKLKSDSYTNSQLQNIRSYAKKLDFIQLDVGDETAVKRTVSNIYQKYDRIDGIIHLAGITDEGMIQTKSIEDFQRVFYPKIFGSINIVNAIKEHSSPDFILFGSSMAAVNGDIGQSAYVMANYFLNSFAKKCKVEWDLPVVSISWDTWQEVGMAKQFAEAVNYHLSDSFISKTNNTTEIKEVKNKEEGGDFKQKLTSFFTAKHTYTKGKDWLLDEHTFGSKSIFVGAGYISLFNQHLTSLGIVYPIKINAIQFVSPLMAGEQESVELKIDILKMSQHEYQFSFNQLIPHQQNLLICEGQFHVDPSIHFSPILNINKKLASFDHSLILPKGKSIKEHNKNMRFGPRWDNVREVYYSKDQGIAIIELDKDYLKDMDQYSIHPSMLDNASSFLLDIQYSELNLLPITYKNLRIYRSFTSKIYCFASLERGNQKTISIHLQIFDTNQLCCLECEIIFKEIDQQSVFTNYSLQLGKIGDLTSLHYQPKLSSALASDEVEFETIATGLNFKEVLYGLGVIPNISNDVIFQFGLEASGIVTRIGKHVTRFKVGDPVVGFVSSGFDKLIKAKERNLVLKPSKFSFEEAAAIPVAYLTAYYSLVKKANLQPGEKILIHSASGGVGLAAIEIAKAIGAEVYATAGTEEKQDYLRKMGVKSVFHSRQLDFVDNIKDLTNGYGVDVVLNSTTGITFKKSLEMMAPYGRFLEMGVKDIIENTSLEMNIFKKGISFIAIDISSAIPHFLQMLQEIFMNLDNEVWQLISVTTFEILNTQMAFKYMASGKHIGKVVIVHPLIHQLSQLNAKYTRLEKYADAILNEEGINSFLEGLNVVSSSLSYTNVYATKKIRIAKNILRHTNTFTHQLVNKRKRPPLITNYVPPANEMERSLLNVIEEFLGMEGIGVQDNFFSLGLSSLDVIHIKSSINKQFKLDIPIVQFYNYPTTRELSQWIGSQSSVNTFLIANEIEVKAGLIHE